MCGIAGIYLLHNQHKPDHQILSLMNDSQLHRGPDAGDYFYQPSIGLAHRRLSIIDIAGSPQPMQSANQQACIVFNGEIYNYRELRQQLLDKGYKFNTNGDTETILNAWLEWGEDCVHHLRGMFAFAIWDASRNCLFLARDRLGIKPLFYSLLDNGQFVFGSELKVLRNHPDFVKQLRDSTIEDYFSFGYVPEPYTIYQHSYKLSPGHTLLLQHGIKALPEPKQYWDVPTQWQQPLSEQQLSEGLIARFREAVDIRLVAEVPLGAFLSGGVDSSAVVAMMAGLQSDPVNTCSIGFDSPKFNETDFARQVAARYNTHHHENIVSQNDFELLDKLADLYDEPYADSSAIPTYRVCQMARQQVTVALSGDGADELFAGYRRYKLHQQEESFRNMLPLVIRKPLFGILGKLYPKLDWAPRFLRAKTTFQSLAMDTVAAYHNSIAILRTDQRDRLFSSAFKQRLNGYNSLQVFRRHGEKVSHLDPMKIAQYLDMKTYLVGDILTKVDRASMAHSLEVRVPFLDHKLVEWAFSADSSANLKDGVGKYTLKKVLQPYLPDDVLYRKKMGFAVPLAEWFRGPLKHKLQDKLLSEVMLNSGYFNVAELKQLIDDHKRGLKDNSASLWTLLMFAAFLERNS
ncbi:XrtA/PEP-CTERM system amidotransferase [Alishewanella tabrizica]|uniref:asparagine synthase (glutamine-hydrolyzing) n=1 Tax=Alishewanella tabrizica TaxID=671278 RepID=A0ABQ2WM76_9ALTE|nr:XrtA/PEP-CTERM system amidotransferase [Alishewanella tabrizica]GGW62618.1 amidotransferase 1, exosortase A system-associated [Alishewanella tabrizica]